MISFQNFLNESKKRSKFLRESKNATVVNGMEFVDIYDNPTPNVDSIVQWMGPLGNALKQWGNFNEENGDLSASIMTMGEWDETKKIPSKDFYPDIDEEDGIAFISITFPSGNFVDLPIGVVEGYDVNVGTGGDQEAFNNEEEEEDMDTEVTDEEASEGLLGSDDEEDEQPDI